MRVLGVESSCDETAFAVVEDGRRVLSNAVASQVDLHARYGGVVPEIASRAHLEALAPMLRRALDDAGASLDSIDAIAATQGPGLAGCLLAGLEFAKGLAARHGKPLVGVHHIAGHIHSSEIGRDRDAWGAPVDGPADPAPRLALVVSGGHSSLALARGPLDVEVLGETLDDAVGEAYDKSAKLLGLGYPGGPLMDKLAAQGDPKAFDFPRPVLRKAGCAFSFSGLKTAVARAVEIEERAGRDPRADPVFVRDAAASFQAAAIDVLLGKAGRALEEHGLDRLAIVGGVACNRGLRAAARERLAGVRVAIPDPEFCTDNAAMIAGLGFHVLAERGVSTLGINAAPGLALA